jgi:biotin-dependent carboxylase-like uncharacterized protein
VDRDAFIVANRLVGNADGGAGLECTMTGPVLEFHQDAAVAVTGADVPVNLNAETVPMRTTLRVKAGDRLGVGAARAGCRAYVAIAGGIAVSPVMGSRATYVRGRLGGVDGRPLRKGDRLPIGPPPTPLERLEGQTIRQAWLSAYASEIECRVILGPQADRFPPDAIETFLTSAYRVTPQADRMGCRLEGPAIRHLSGYDILSDGIPLGGVQIPGDGQPIILLVDRQSTGGYTKIATVLSVDIPRIAQARAKHQIRFGEVSVKQAHGLLAAHRAWLDAAVVTT